MVSAGGAAKTAIVLPAFLMKSIKEIKRAEKYIEAGADMKKVEQELGMFKLPTSIDDGVMRMVLDDSKASLRFQATEGLPGLRRVQNIADPEGPNMLINLPMNDIQKLPQILNHPELFTAVPDLKNVRVVSGFGQFRGASYIPGEDVIRMGADNSPESYIKTLLHEVQHAIQHRFNMNTGGSPSGFLSDPKALKEAKTHFASQQKSFNKLKEKYNDSELKEIIKERQRTIGAAQQKLFDVEDKAYGAYTRIPGEREATAVELMRAEGIKTKPTIDYYGQDVYKLTEFPSEGVKYDERPEIKEIIDRALNEAARTNKKGP
jgi:hypothetical protein